MNIRKQSGKVSRTIVLALLSVAAQATPLVLWMRDVVSAETWAIVAGVSGMVSAVATIVLRQLSGEPMKGAK